MPQGPSLHDKGVGAAIAHYRGVTKDHAGAEEAYRTAIRLDPKYAIAHNNLGFLLQFERNDVGGADIAYRAAIAADPNFAAGHHALGRLLHPERKDFDNAQIQ